MRPVGHVTHGKLAHAANSDDPGLDTGLVTAFVPYHARIAADIRQQIRDGRLRPGDKLPTRPQLAGHYGVGTSTVDVALTVLRTEGWVRGHQGVGLFVADNPPS